jgi:hypothetical protein
MTPKADPVAELLCAAGARTPAPDERARRVEAAVRLEWQDVVEKRSGRRRAAWIAVSCLTSAALIALGLHAHVGPASPVERAEPVSYARPRYVAHVEPPQRPGSYFRMNNEDRPPDRGVPRHMLASYSEPMR